MDEPEVITRARRGDPQAWAALFRDGRGPVHRAVYRRTSGNGPLTEDIVSETFVRAMRGITGFRWTGRSVNGWLVTIAKNLLADHYKSAWARCEVSVDTVPATSDQCLVPSAEDVAVIRITAGLTAVALGRAMAGLTAGQQRVVQLRFFEDRSVNETAQAMSLSVGAAKTLQCRAVRALGRTLGSAATGRTGEAA